MYPSTSFSNGNILYKYLIGESENLQWYIHKPFSNFANITEHNYFDIYPNYCLCQFFLYFITNSYSIVYIYHSLCNYSSIVGISSPVFITNKASMKIDIQVYVDKTFLLDKCPRMQLLGHMVSVCIVL